MIKNFLIDLKSMECKVVVRIEIIDKLSKVKIISIFVIISIIVVISIIKDRFILFYFLAFSANPADISIDSSVVCFHLPHRSPLRVFTLKRIRDDKNNVLEYVWHI